MGDDVGSQLMGGLAGSDVVMDVWIGTVVVEGLLGRVDDEKSPARRRLGMALKMGEEVGW
jgi:hypothetical protein